MKYNKFCKIVSTANSGRVHLIKMGTAVISSPVWAIYDYNSDEIISQGKYKWVSERYRREFIADDEKIQELYK